VHFVFCSFYSALSLCLGLLKHTMQLEGCFGALSVYVQVKINALSILLLDVYKDLFVRNWFIVLGMKRSEIALRFSFHIHICYEI
jgi:hypothetical protein